jgi:hypothetical protein
MSSGSGVTSKESDQLDAEVDHAEINLTASLGGVNISQGQTQLSASSGDDDSGFGSLHLPVDTYQMDRANRGHLILICNTQFHPKLGLGERKGTKNDIDAINRVFSDKLGFNIECRNNLTASQMLEFIVQATSSSHRQYSSFALVILTHGKSQGKLFGTDAEIKLEQLLKPVKDCQDLVGKPKMVFVQACRGTEFDRGIKMSSDQGGEDQGSMTVPVEADFLYVYSTVDGYVSFQNPNRGSWFIQALCQVFEEQYKQHDILTMLTHVCCALAHGFSSNTPSRPSTHNLKQVSSVTTTLTKILRF